MQVSIYDKDLKWHDKPIKNPSFDIYIPKRVSKIKDLINKYEKKKIQKSKSFQDKRASDKTLSQPKVSILGVQDTEGEPINKKRNSRSQSVSHHSQSSLPAQGPRSPAFPSDYAQSNSSSTYSQKIRRNRSQRHNMTYDYFKSDTSEKTNKLKANLYGKRYGNYTNKPLCYMDFDSEPVMFKSNKKKRKPSKSAIKKNNFIFSSINNSEGNGHYQQYQRYQAPQVMKRRRPKNKNSLIYGSSKKFNPKRINYAQLMEKKRRKFDQRFRRKQNPSSTQLEDIIDDYKFNFFS